MCSATVSALKSHCSLHIDSLTIALPLPGNPLAQEIMSLYQEPDGTRRLLNYLLDNLAGAMKRSKSPPLCGRAVSRTVAWFYFTVGAEVHLERM